MTASDGSVATRNDYARIVLQSAMRRLLSAVIAALVLALCSTRDPDLSSLQRDSATALRMPDAVDLAHFSGDRQSTIDGHQTAFDAHVFGVEVSNSDVHAFYERELLRLGWKPDPAATSPDTVELDAWGWCKGAMIFRIGIQDQARAFRPDFYRGQTLKSVFDARIQGRDPARGCPARVAP